MIIGAMTPQYSNKYFNSIEEPIKLIYNAGANAVELSFGDPESLHWVKITPALQKLTSKFKVVTIHAPCADVTYKNDIPTRKLLSKLDLLARKTAARHIVFHPHLIEDFSVLQGFKHRILFENMHPESPGGKTVEDMKKYFRKLDCGFVLDVAHACETDPSMELANELVKAFENKLEEFHVSAPVEGNPHSVISNFSDADKIINILKLKSNIPIILECGNIKSKIPDTLKIEINFIGKAFE